MKQLYERKSVAGKGTPRIESEEKKQKKRRHFTRSGEAK